MERLARRDFLGRTLGMGGGAALLVQRMWAGEGDAQAAKVLARTMGVDMHNHVYPAGTEPHLHLAPQERQTAASLSLGAELQRTGLAAVCASFVLDFARNEKPGDARSNYLHWLDALDAELARGHVKRALRLRDIEDAHSQKKPVIVQTVEGAHFIEGKLERVAEVYQRGLRHLQLLHERDDLVTPLGDVNTVAEHLGGLTAFGAEVIRECNRLGILVDLAHASHKTVVDALQVSAKPVLISHTSLDTHTGGNANMAKMMAPRLISKEHAKVVAEAGGVIGVWTHLAASLEDFVRSIREMVEAVGAEHVGIGSDTDLLAARPGQGTNAAWAGWSGEFFPAVVGEMLRQGFAPDEIAQIGGGNYCRLFGQAMAK